MTGQEVMDALRVVFNDAEFAVKLRKTLDEVTRERDHWKAEAIRLGSRARADRMHATQTTEIRVQIDDLILTSAYSTAAVRREIILTLVRDLERNFAERFGK
jgi:hypothetical protein